MSSLDRLLAASLPLVPKSIVRRVARPYIAGETLADLIAVVRSLNTEGFMTAAGILGEFVDSTKEAEGAVREYEELLAAIQTHALDSNVPLKLTHLGLKLDPDLCYRNVRRLVAAARDRGTFIRIDMEDSSCTDDTLAIHERLRGEFENVGTVIQACLRRSLVDVRRLAGTRANIRLCKGIYVEPRRIALTNREVIRDNFTWLLEELLEGGAYVGIATHDEALVWRAMRLIDRRGLAPTRYEFQMLLGVEAPLRRIIRDAGHRLRVAVPFGPNWYPYSVRRLRRNPAIAGHVARALLRRRSASRNEPSPERDG